MADAGQGNNGDPSNIPPAPQQQPAVDPNAQPAQAQNNAGPDGSDSSSDNNQAGSNGVQPTQQPAGSVPAQPAQQPVSQAQPTQSLLQQSSQPPATALSNVNLQPRHVDQHSQTTDAIVLTDDENRRLLATTVSTWWQPISKTGRRIPQEEIAHACMDNFSLEPTAVWAIPTDQFGYLLEFRYASEVAFYRDAVERSHVQSWRNHSYSVTRRPTRTGDLALYVEMALGQTADTICWTFCKPRPSTWRDKQRATDPQPGHLSPTMSHSSTDTSLRQSTNHNTNGVQQGS